MKRGFGIHGSVTIIEPFFGGGAEGRGEEEELFEAG